MQKMGDALKTDRKLESSSDEEAARDCLKVMTKASVKVSRAEKLTLKKSSYVAIILIIARPI